MLKNRPFFIALRRKAMSIKLNNEYNYEYQVKLVDLFKN